MPKVTIVTEVDFLKSETTRYVKSDKEVIKLEVGNFKCQIPVTKDVLISIVDKGFDGADLILPPPNDGETYKKAG